MSGNGVHCSAPSWWKMCSCLDTCAGVRIVSCFLVVGGLRSRLKARLGSELRSDEKAMFARWRFRLVIWTARTAA